MSIIIIIFFVIVLFVIDGYLGSYKYTQLSELEKLINNVKKHNSIKYKNFDRLYGKDFDILMNKEIYGNFPFSLISNFGDIEKINYLIHRLK